MTTTPTSRKPNNGVPVGNVPADGGTGCLRPSEPAMARAGTIRKKRPIKKQMPSVVLNQGVLPLSPAKADPLLLEPDANAYVISVSPWGPGLASEFSAGFSNTDAPAKLRM